MNKARLVDYSELLLRYASIHDKGDVDEIMGLASLANDGDREVLLKHPEFLAVETSALVEGRVRVAEIDGRAIGFSEIAIDGANFEVEGLFVAPSYWRNGIGRALIDDVFALATASGFDKVFVTANPHALEFYRSCGFDMLGNISTRFGPAVKMYRHL